MTISVNPGEEVSFPAEFLSRHGHTEPESLRVSIVDPSGRQVVTDALPERLSPGVYRFTYRVPADAAPGQWSARWTAVLDGTEMNDADLFEVRAALPGLKTVPAPGSEPSFKESAPVRDSERQGPRSKKGRGVPTAAISRLLRGLAVLGLLTLILAPTWFAFREPLPPDQALNEGLAAHEEGDLRRAHRYYLDVLNQEPKNKYALNNLGRIEQSQGKPEVARAFYRRTLDSDPGYLPALMNLGSVNETLGEDQQAMDTYLQVILVDNDHVEAHLRLGLLMINKLGRSEEGTAVLRRAVGLDPTVADRIPEPLRPDAGQAVPEAATPSPAG